MRHNAQYKRLRVVNACSSAGALIQDSCRKNRIFQAWVWGLKTNIYSGMPPEMFSSWVCSVHWRPLPPWVQGRPRGCPLIRVIYFFPHKNGCHFLCRLHDEPLISFNEEELGQWKEIRSHGFTPKRVGWRKQGWSQKIWSQPHNYLLETTTEAKEIMLVWSTQLQRKSLRSDSQG